MVEYEALEPPLFSPFDALGLPHQRQQDKQVKLAFKKAALVCHPDKRPHHGIPETRWPQMWHIQMAMHYLVHPGTTDEALQRFKSFPQTFFPNEKPTFRIPHNLSSALRQCSICLIVVDRNDLFAHLESEHRDGCETHLAETVGLQVCCFCSSAMTTDAYTVHMAEWHICPLCECPEASILDHVQTIHDLDCCTDCELSSNPVGHITTMHSASECLDCGGTIFDEAMFRHMKNEHGFQPCQGCERWEISSSGFRHHCEERHTATCVLCGAIFMDKGLMNGHVVEDHGLQTCPSCPSNEVFDMGHVLDRHSLKPCVECRLDFEENRLATHLRFRHKWIVCDICGSPEPDERALRIHCENHTVCRLCDEPMVKLQYRQHLQDSHALLLCPLCDGAFSPEELPRHFRETHPQTKLCTVCRCPQTEDGMDRHMVEKHRWAKCHFCSELFPETMQNVHEKSHRNQAGSDCSQSVEQEQAESLPVGQTANTTPLCLLKSQLETLTSQARQQGSKDALSKAIAFIRQAILYEGPMDGHQEPAPSTKRSMSLPSVPASRKRARLARKGLSVLKETLTSHETITLFKQMVVSDNIPLDYSCLAARGKHSDAYKRLSRISLFVDSCESAVGFAKVCQYYGLAQMARLLDSIRKQSARQRTDPGEIDKILALNNYERNGQNRNKLHHQLRLGRKILRICGSYPGILCFLAVSKTNLDSLVFTEKDVDEFHTEVAQYTHLWTEGDKHLELLEKGVSR